MEDMFENLKPVFRRLIKTVDKNKKLLLVQKLYQQQVPIRVSKIKNGETIVKFSPITKEPRQASGVWGYGGDSIAVYFENEPFPAEDVIKAAQEQGLNF